VQITRQRNVPTNIYPPQPYHIHLVLVSPEFTRFFLNVNIMEMFLARELRLQSRTFGDTRFVRIFGLARWVLNSRFWLTANQMLTGNSHTNVPHVLPTSYRATTEYTNYSDLNVKAIPNRLRYVNSHSNSERRTKGCEYEWSGRLVISSKTTEPDSKKRIDRL
jgi:hypothetical protein